MTAREVKPATRPDYLSSITGIKNGKRGEVALQFVL